MRLLVTAGGTREPIDAVRFIGNRSSGRLGLAVAAAAIERGHAVTLLLGPVQATPPDGIEVIPIETTADLRTALRTAWPAADAIVMAAAVADYRPKQVHAGKRRRAGPMTLELLPTPDLLAELAGSKRSDQRVIGFSLDEDSPQARARAREKLVRKGCDLLVFNPIATMEADDVTAELLHADGRHEPLGKLAKPVFAVKLLEAVERLVCDQPPGR